MPAYTITATCAGETATAVVTIPDLTGTLTVTQVEDLDVSAAIAGLSDDATVTVDWGDGTTAESVTLSGGAATATHTYADATGSPYTVTVTGDTSGAVLTDTVTVTDPPPVPLDAPAGLALDASADPPTESSFSVQWDAVAGATGYTATASDGVAADVPGAIDASGDPVKASFSSLTSDTEYTVSVVALGDGTTTTDSPAATLTVSTTAAA